jgi:hypothetical protein
MNDDFDPLTPDERNALFEPGADLEAKKAMDRLVVERFEWPDPTKKRGRGSEGAPFASR